MSYYDTLSGRAPSGLPNALSRFSTSVPITTNPPPITRFAPAYPFAPGTTSPLPPTEVPVSIRSAPAYRGSYLPAPLEARPMGPIGSTGQAATTASRTGRAARAASMARQLVQRPPSVSSGLGNAWSGVTQSARNAWAPASNLPADAGKIRTGLSRAGGVLRRGSIYGLPAQIGAGFLDTHTGDDPFSESAETALRVGGTAATFGGPVAGAVAGLGVGLGDLGLRLTGVEDGVSSIFSGGGGGYAPDAGIPLMETYDALGVPGEEREEWNALVDVIAKEGLPDTENPENEWIVPPDYAEGGKAAVDWARNALVQDALTREQQAQQLRLQQATQSFLSEVGGEQVQRANDNLLRAQETAQYLSPAEAQIHVANAEREVQRSQDLNSAYAAQAAIMPQYESLLEHASMQEQIQNQLAQQMEYERMAQQLGLDTSSGETQL